MRLVLVAALALTVSASQAHDHNHPELNAWYKSLHSGKGPCCDDKDFEDGSAMALADPDVDNTNGHYRVRIKGEWVDVDDEAVLKEPNRAGQPIVWFWYQDGHPKVRCFLPGAGA